MNTPPGRSQEKFASFSWIKYVLAIQTLFVASIQENYAATIKFLPPSGPQPSIVSPSGKVTQLYTKSAALVISISQYKSGESGWHKLPATAKEMDEVGDTLSAQGFEVIRLNDPTRAELTEEMQRFLGKYGADENARLLFFYSGHGYTSNINQMGYIVPIDAGNPDTDYPKFISQAISLESFIGWIKQFKAKHFLATFDSCFSGSVFSSKKNSNKPTPRPLDAEGRWRYLTNASFKSARQFISAGGPDEELPATSTFSKLFIAGINGDASTANDGYITGKELGIYLEQTVSRYRAGKQNPISGFPQELQQSYGDLIFQYQKFRQSTNTRQEISNLNNNLDPISAEGFQPKGTATPQLPPAATTTPRTSINGTNSGESTSRKPDRDDVPAENKRERDYRLAVVIAGLEDRFLSDHRDALKTFAPLIPLDLSGDEIAKILGSTSLTYRYNSLMSILSNIQPESLSGESVKKILSSESLSYRVNLIRLLVPLIMPGINESETLSILDGLSFSNRVTAINLISLLIRKPISTNGINLIIEDTYPSDKPKLILSLSH